MYSRPVSWWILHSNEKESEWRTHCPTAGAGDLLLLLRRPLPLLLLASASASAATPLKYSE